MKVRKQREIILKIIIKKIKKNKAHQLQSFDMLHCLLQRLSGAVPLSLVEDPMSKQCFLTYLKVIPLCVLRFIFLCTVDIFGN